MTDSVTSQGTTTSRYRSKRQKSRAISNDGDTAVPQSSLTFDVPKAIGPAVLDPVRAAIGFGALVFRSSDNHRRTSTGSLASGCIEDALFDAENRQHEAKAIDECGNNPIDASSLCATRTRSLHSMAQSLNHSQPTASQLQHGPPKSSEINATTISKPRRVPDNGYERHTGCFNFLRRERKCREGPACATKAGASSSPADPAVRHICSAYEDKHERLKVSPMKGTESEVFGRPYAQEYHRVKGEVSGLSHEPAKQGSVNYFTGNTVSRDRRPLEYADLAMNTVSSDFENSSPRSPYDMRYGAVQPEYFSTDGTLMYRQIARNDFQRQSSTQWRTSSTTTSSIPPDIRSGMTLSTSPFIRRKPLVDLTPQYQPPPQHRHKGHGYYPEQLGSGKLVDYATSPKQ